MPKLSLAVAHPLSRDEAAARLKGLLAKVKEKHGDKFSDLKEEWGEHSGKFSFKTYGFAVKGAVAIEEGQVKVNGDLPFAAIMFKGRIEQELRDTLTKVLNSPQRDGGMETV